MTRKRETAAPEIASVMSARRRGEKRSESQPQKGLPREPRRELMLRAPAASCGGYADVAEVWDDLEVDGAGHEDDE